MVLRAEAVHTVAQGLIGCFPEASASGRNSALMRLWVTRCLLPGVPHLHPVPIRTS